jgi:hypothetical protein
MAVIRALAVVRAMAAVRQVVPMKPKYSAWKNASGNSKVA